MKCCKQPSHTLKTGLNVVTGVNEYGEDSSQLSFLLLNVRSEKTGAGMCGFGD